MAKPCMSLSLDLDNKWSYLKTHGDDEWKTWPSYLDTVVPRVIEFLRKRDISITFFIVGQDAALEKNHAALKMLPDAGHEIASHSFRHEPWLHLYSEADLDRELADAEEAIERATGVKVRGFRGPGFSLSTTTLTVLRKRGYHYDATAFPNILNPLARAYFFAHSNLSDEEKEQRKALFGTFSDAFRPIKPYRWNLPETSVNTGLLELPVTTMPVFKTPIHFSYLIYLASFNMLAAKAYLNLTITLCRLTRTEPSLLLHPLDFLGREDAPELAFFPGMKLPAERKLEMMDYFFDKLGRNFEPVTMDQHIARIEQRESDSGRTLRHFQPSFAQDQTPAPDPGTHP